MISTLSAIAVFLTNPINTMIILCLIGLLIRFSGFRKTGGAIMLSGFAWIVMATHTPAGNALILPLEQRFEKAELPDKIIGIISLGGSIELQISHGRGVFENADASERLYETVLLARKYPEAKIVFTGGSGKLAKAPGTDFDIVTGYMVSLGIARERVLVEGQASNTYENVQFSRQLVYPKPGENWVLVTSAFHMPRAVALFRKANWEVLPWPVDYQTHGVAAARDFGYDEFSNTTNFHLALKEWLGLVSYKILGRIDKIFPKP